MKLEKIIIDKNIYNGRYDAADVVIDVELWEGMHYAYNFVAKAICGQNSFTNHKHENACFDEDIQKKFGNITAKIMMYEYKKMEELKR